jgi:hypothetical protein
MQANPQNSSLSLVPLGAGDLIDRAIRFYRNNFWTFVWIAAPPILVGTLISIGWTMLGRQYFSFAGENSFDAYFLESVFNWFGSIIIWLVEGIATLIVMGGASRNFVRHILFGEPVTVKETYSNSWSRIGGLFVASTLITFLVVFIGGMIFYLGFICLFIGVAIVAYVFSWIPVLSVIFSLAVGLGILFATGWLFFLVASRFAYVPQIMLVEGQGVFSAVGRSTSLASSNVKRLYGLFVFTTMSTYAALLLFYIPLGWYAYLNGIELFTFNQNAIPAWYTIANQVISQASLILLMPVWMIGLCLLYVDERVRHEGYDIELMAARRLGEIPALPSEFMNPLQPALAVTQFPSPPQQNDESKKSSLTTLGLN